jgi:hypothetical protein
VEEDEDAMLRIISSSRAYAMFKQRGKVFVNMDGFVVEGVVGGGRKLGIHRRERRVILGARAGTEVAIGARCRADP